MPAAQPGDLRGRRPAAGGHPLLAAVVELADGALVLTGRLSAAGGSRWLADHVAGGRRAGARHRLGRVGAARRRRGRLRRGRGTHPPGAAGAARRRGTAGAGRRRTAPARTVAARCRSTRGPDADDRRPAGPATPPARSPRSRPTCRPRRLAGQWPPGRRRAARRHRTSTTAPRRPVTATARPSSGLVAAWRHGDRPLAEVALPEGAGEDTDAFGIHPALLDAALHPVALDGRYADGRVLAAVRLERRVAVRHRCHVGSGSG